MAEKVVHIIPDKAVLLDVRTKFPCTVEGCDKMLPNYGALRMHLVKTHKCYQNEEDRALGLSVKKVDTTKYLYHCPVETCPKYHHQGETTSYFTSMKLLKQHYGKLHADKKYKCKKCDRGFGLERDKRRHEELCGFLLKCKTCGCPYSTVEAMLTHCRRKQHDPPDECISKRTKQSQVKSRKKTSPPAPSIILINVLPPQKECPPLSNPGAVGLRHILPKPTIQKAVPLTTLSMAQGQFMVTQEGSEPKRSNTEPQSKKLLREQGICTSISTDIQAPFSVREYPSATDACTMVSPENRDAGVTSVSPGNKDAETSMTDTCISRFVGINNLIARNTHGPLPNSSINTNFHVNSSSCQQDSYNRNCDPMEFNPPHVNSLLETRCNKGTMPVFGMGPSDSVLSTTGMQTLMSLPLRSELSIAVAETQTPGDYILKEAMASANIGLNKESKGSQVSPRAKCKGQRNVVPVNSQSCQTSRLSDHHRSPKRKRQRKCASSDYAVSCQNKGWCDESNKCLADSPSSQNYLSSLSPGVVTGFTDPLNTGVLPGTGLSGTVVQPGHNRAVTSLANISTVSTGINGTGGHRLLTSHSAGQSSMVLDGPHNEEDIPVALAEYDEIHDHQTQTMGILEELYPPPASISTQTHQSYLASDTAALPEGANLQDTHTQTFESAFKPPSSTGSDTSQFRNFEATTKNPVLAGQIVQGEESVQDTFETRYLYSAVNNNESACSNATDVQCAPITFTNSDVQTSATDLLNLLDMGVQADSGPGTTTQTQTDLDEILEQFCHNMETQTANDILQDLEFSDIQIQTNLDLEYLEDTYTTVETQTMWHSAATGSPSLVEQSDMQTQTLFRTTNFDPDLTDSHTQTPWEDLTSLILQDF